MANGNRSIAIGRQSASGDNGTAVGSSGVAGTNSVAIGNLSNASAARCSRRRRAVICQHTRHCRRLLSTASGTSSVATGGFFDFDDNGDFDDREATTASGLLSSAYGVGSLASGARSLALGTRSIAVGTDSIAVGSSSAAEGNGVAMGANSGATANGVAIGVGASATAANSVALGGGSVADRAGTVSIGAAGAERILVNVAEGTAGTDAANVRQMQAGDAAILSQANANAAERDAATLSQANAYTDTRLAEIAGIAADFDTFARDVDSRFRSQDKRIDRVGALNAAMVGMAASAGAVEGGSTRIGIAAGTYNGAEALSIGVQRRVGKRAAFTLGGAISGSERSGTLGVGIGF